MDHPKNQNNAFQVLLLIVSGLLLIFLWKDATWALWTATTLGLLGLCSKKMAESISRGWMGIGWVLSLFMPKIILSLFYLLILFPIALLSRLFSKKDPLQLQAPKESNWRENQRVFQAEDFKKLW